MSVVNAQKIGISDYDPSFVDKHLISERWTTDNNLPVNIINQTYQTPDGYLWLATFNGLVRFDGVDFKEYNAGNTPNLVSNRILTIQQGAGNAFWLNTEQGHLIVSENGQFTSFPDLPPTDHFYLFSDADTTWIASEKGLYQYENGILIPYMPEIFQQTHIKSMLRSRDGTLWVFGNKKIAWRIKYGKTDYYIDTVEIPNNTHTAFEDNQEKIWVGGFHLGYIKDLKFNQITIDESYLKKWNREDPIFHQFKALSEKSILVSAETGIFKLENDTLLAIDLHEKLHFKSPAVMNGGTVTVCPDNSVWNVVDNRVYKDGNFHHQTNHMSETIFCDREQNLWFTTFQNGLVRYRTADLENITFNHSTNNFYGAYSDSYSGYWIGGWFTDLTHIDVNGKINKVESDLEFGITAAFAEDTNRTLYVGFNRCLPKHRTDTGRCLEFEKIKGLEERSVFAILAAEDHSIWYGTNNGVFNLKDNELKRIESIDVHSLQPVRYFLETGSQQIWMATNGGGVLQYSNGKISVYNKKSGLSSDNIRALYEDEFGFIWIATEDRGLNRLDPNTGKVVKINASDGLFDDGLHTILSDDYARLWMSTNRGIFSVEFNQLHGFASGLINRIYSKAYNERDGMLIREANGGFQNAGLKTHDGKLWFTTQKGIVIVDPSQPPSTLKIPDVLIEGIHSSGKSLLNLSDDSQLHTDQRSINILYNCPVFFAPERIRYRYKLEGFDTDWVDAGNRREAIYTNIPSGNYTFKVAAYVDGEQEDSPTTSFAFIVSPHFYETSWFTFLIILFMFIILGGGYRVRLSHLKKRENELELLVEKRTSALTAEKKLTEVQAEKLKVIDQEKNRFFANLSHEFRTPLTLTIGPLTDLREGKYGPLTHEVSHQIDLGLHNSQRLLRLVEQLLDLTRLEAKKFELNLKPGNLSRYLKAVAKPFYSAAEQKSIQFITHIPDKPIRVLFDPAHFDKIISNLLSNAFKFTPENGSITLQLEKNDHLAIISVRDTGYGIAPEHLPRLFERFYQIQKSEMHPGSGIGLSLAKELTELHDGKIDVKSELNKGTVFSIKIPLLLQEQDHSQVTELADVSMDDIHIKNYLDGSFKLAQNNIDDSKSYQSLNKTILIVDDHSDIRTFLKSHISEEYNVIEASSGNEAMKVIENHLPDLIISDVMMPDGDGFSLLKNLRENSETDFLSIILLTARSEAQDKLKGLGIGADDYLTKPFSVKELKLRVQNIFKRQNRLLKYYEQQGGHKIEKENSLHPDPVQIDSAEHQYLEQIRQIVQQNMHDENFSVEVLADKMFQSRTQVYRKLRNLINETPSALIRRMRLERSAELLVQKAGTVSEVAYSTGFRSVTQFSKSFREHFHKTPTEFASDAISSVPEK